MNRKQSFHHLQDMIILNGTDAIVRLRGPSRSPVMDQLTASALARMKAKTRRCFFAAFKSLSTRLVRWPNNFRFHVLQNDFALICCRRTSRKLSQRARKAKCTRCSCIPQLRLCSLGLEKKTACKFEAGHSRKLANSLLHFPSILMIVQTLQKDTKIKNCLLPVVPFPFGCSPLCYRLTGARRSTDGPKQKENKGK